MINAEDVLNSNLGEAEELLKDPSKVDEILFKIEEKLKRVPAIGEAISEVPLMISMVKSYITKEYTNVSGKVIVLMVGAFLYLIKKKDLIPDGTPVLGYADDIAVLGLAFKLCSKELEEYKVWRDTTYKM